MNELNRHKKSDKIKWVATALAGILLAGACATTIGMGVKHNGWFKKEETKQEQPAEQKPAENTTADGGMIVTPVHAKQMSLLSVPMVKVAGDVIGGTVDADRPSFVESSYTLTATVTPAEATNKSVTYSVAWQNPSSSWASGKSVTEYVRVTQATAGSLTATVDCLKAFGEKVIVTCTSDEDDSVSATCVVDYVKRVNSVSLNISGDNVTGATGTMRVVGFEDNITVGYTVNYSAGTLQGNFAGGLVRTTLTDSLFNTCKNKTTSGNFSFNQESVSFMGADLTNAVSKTVTLPKCTAFISPLGDPGKGYSQWTQAFYDYCYNNGTVKHATVSMDYSYGYEGHATKSGTATCDIMFRSSSVAVAVGGVSLDNSSLIF